jgi:hypothetical protein
MRLTHAEVAQVVQTVPQWLQAYTRWAARVACCAGSPFLPSPVLVVPIRVAAVLMRAWIDCRGWKA